MATTEMAEKVCPVCGSKEFDTRHEQRRIGSHFGGYETLNEAILVCRKCGADGDFGGENDRAYEAAMVELNKRAVARMLETLSEKGATNAHFERVMGLPQRTTARWKKDGASAAAVSLLKAVVTYPWIMEVAEKGFEPLFARQVLVREASNALTELCDASGISQHLVAEPGPTEHH